jgi:lipid A disaccharide synthetase
VIIPVVESVRGLIEQHLPAWPKQPYLVTGEEDKFRAFKLARAALAASGTVTLELALAGTPMVVAYKVGAITAAAVRPLITASSAVLANLVLDEKAFPELIQEYCTPANLASALTPILDEGPARDQATGGAGQNPAAPAAAEGHAQRGRRRCRALLRREGPRLAPSRAARARRVGWGPRRTAASPAAR